MTSDRFMEYKPIKAKRPTLVERAGKWSRRHRAIVVLDSGHARSDGCWPGRRHGPDRALTAPASHDELAQCK